MPIVPKKNSDGSFTVTLSEEEYETLTKQIEQLNRKRDKSKEYAQKRRELFLQKQQEELNKDAEEKGEEAKQVPSKTARRTTTKLIFGKPVEE